MFIKINVLSISTPNSFCVLLSQILAFPICAHTFSYLCPDRNMGKENLGKKYLEKYQKVLKCYEQHRLSVKFLFAFNVSTNSSEC